MKTLTLAAAVITLLGLAGCSTPQERGGMNSDRARAGSPKPGPETVLIIYHVQPGKEPEFQAVLARAWDAYRSHSMVLARPHVIVREAEAAGQSRFVEIFTWVRPPNHPPASVRALWQEEQSLCEPRNGRNGIEGGPVELVTGK